MTCFAIKENTGFQSFICSSGKRLVYESPQSFSKIFNSRLKEELSSYQPSASDHVYTIGAILIATTVIGFITFKYFNKSPPSLNPQSLNIQPEQLLPQNNEPLIQEPLAEEPQAIELLKEPASPPVQRNFTDYLQLILAQDVKGIQEMLKDVDVNSIVDKKLGTTLAHWAIITNTERHCNILPWLFPSFKPKVCNNPTVSEIFAILEILIRKGIFLWREDFQGKTPLDWALENTFEPLKMQIVKFILKHGAERNIKDCGGKTLEEYEFLYSCKQSPKNYDHLPDEIPQALYNDPSLPKFFSEFTRKMIRNPVLLPLSRVQLVDKSELVILIKKYFELSTLRTYIEYRLHYLLTKKYRMAEVALMITEPKDRTKLVRYLIKNGAEQQILDGRGKSLKDYPSQGNLPSHFKMPNEVPDKFEEDETYPLLKCPITQSLIIDPVLDPTNCITLYERTAILQYLKTSASSPMTRKPLSEQDLIEVPNIVQYIKKRLHIPLKPFFKKGFLK